jgi:amidase
VAGLVSSGGSFAREGFRPTSDATVVARLREAGAIVLGKTNVPEYCWFLETDNAIYGRTNNPLDERRTPGGSSGGEAAILGADASPVGIGSDGGASIRVPAHYCGIVGLRPTTGRVPETGIWPSTRATGLGDVNCVGPLARFVEDLALLLPVIAGPDGIDPYVPPVALVDWRSVTVERLRVAFYTYDGLAQVTEGTRAAVERAAHALGEVGCEVVEEAPGNLEEATDLFFKAMAADGGAAARADLAPARGQHMPRFAALLDDLAALAMDAAGLFEIQRRVFALRARVRAFLNRFDVVVCPVTTGPAPLHGHWPGEEIGHDSYDVVNYTHVYSLAGCPVVSLPVGEEHGLPVGVQIVARPWAEHVALAAAAYVEDMLGGFRTWPRAAPAAIAPSAAESAHEG